MIERPIIGFEPFQPSEEGAIFGLRNKDGFDLCLSIINDSIFRITLNGPNRPPPPHTNVLPQQAPPNTFKVEKVVDAKAKAARISLPCSDHVFDRWFEIYWGDTPVLEIWEKRDRDGPKLRIFGDTPHKSYCLNRDGITRYTRIDADSLHVGLGEKGAPFDLTRRSFSISGSDAAGYDAYLSDPLYKHTPFLVSLPKPSTTRRSAVALFSASNSDATWDVGRFIDEPWTSFKRYQQEYGGLEEYLLVGEGLSDAVRSFSDLVGKPKLVPRDWLGYLASGMGLGESDDPIAQDLLSEWPQKCKENDIPCSAIHLSSGYTVDEKGDRLVFTMNTKRYPDFAEMVRVFHKAGIKVTPNVKPYVLESHPDFQKLYQAGALFTDPATGSPVVTRIWSSQPAVNAKGSWVDMTSKAGRGWWSRGVTGLINLGVDSIWNDNNEYLLFDDDYVCKDEQDSGEEAGSFGGRASVGLLGRMINTELMAKTSHDALLARNPGRRPFVLTRSANVGTMKYASSTWSGDNVSDWKTLQGSVAMCLNAQLSLLQSYGTDVGGFAGPLPSPELFVRWVQMGVTHPRFCIHSFKPCEKDPTGTKLNNLPWMYPEVVDIIRKEIKWRYTLLPFFNNLNWRSHLYAEPANTWLGWGDFSTDPNLYEPQVLEGFDYWLGQGQILVAGSYHEGGLSRSVYFPASSAEDDCHYFDLHAPHSVHRAGERVEAVSTPLSHFALFAREGTAIPIGKDHVTLTATEGAAACSADGTRVVTIDQGGLVGLDDWRGLLIFPTPSPPAPSRSSSPFAPGASKTFEFSWIEDDGVSQPPISCQFTARFSSDLKGRGGQADEEVEVQVWRNQGVGNFEPLWGQKVWVILPVGDKRKVKGCVERMTWQGREAFGVCVGAPAPHVASDQKAS
ncbi:hypothetical protein IE53DRAFT_385355 [Violaceomyces palustris]|uniref:Uncharacterized protein n=1 Tax=Violaceomyces palustris TaxID=1673888 RepID=A0ACD0P2B7_9BASI|nr:hypothetical protein IE53DRAFT_385355 [Violaceomyces palustris]